MGFMSSKKLKSFLLLLPLLFSACSSLMPKPDHYTISNEQIQKTVIKKFPITKNILTLAQVNLNNPKIKLLPEQNRIATEIDVSLKEVLAGNALNGTLGLNYALRFNASDNSVRLHDVKIDRLDVRNLPQSLQTLAQPTIGALLQQALTDYPVYTLEEKDLNKLQKLGLSFKNLTITEDGLNLHFQPNK